ncbi:hypothetical protein V0M98_34735 (plasmid) [Pseudomonas silesiensis]|uniref:hypothetical protein n=1 Tax=Pseudomonas silesiensis TaxID=1853130 RepID=UPI0030D0287B
MSTPDATLPSLSELEAAIKAVNRHCKEQHLLAVLGISKIQDMFQHTLHIGDLDHYGAMLLKLKNNPRSKYGGDKGLVGSAYQRLDSALDMMVMGVTMSASGKLNKADRSFKTYLHLANASYISRECKTFALQASWGDYIDMVNYLTQDKDNIQDTYLQHCSEEERASKLNDITCSFSLFAGREIAEHLMTLMYRYESKGLEGGKTLPEPMLDLLRAQEEKIANIVMSASFDSVYPVDMVDYYKACGLDKLASATIETAKRALFMRRDHFLKLAEHGVVFDDAWHAAKFNETKTGSGSSATPQLFYHLCVGESSYCPPVAELDEKKRTSTVVECCNSTYKRGPEIAARVKAFLEDYVKDSDTAQDLLNAGLDTDIAKHVPIMLPHAFSKDLGL